MTLAVTLALLALLPPSMAAAQPGDRNTITWSIKPLPAPDGAERAAFTPTVEPGQVITDTVRVRVLSATPIAFQIYASDAFITPTGGFDLLPGAEKPKDLGSWVEMSTQTVLIQPGEFADIPFTIRVPGNATPGDHVGGVVSSLTTLTTSEGGVPIRVERRLGSRIYLRVNGPITPRLEIKQHVADFDGVWNLTGKGSVQTGYTVENTGNVRLKAKQAIVVDTLFGDQQIDAEDVPELLPGSKLTLKQSVDGVFPTGRLKQTVSLTPYPSAEGEVLEPAPEPISDTAVIFALPYALLVFILALGVAVLVVRRRSRRNPPEQEDGAVDG